MYNYNDFDYNTIPSNISSTNMISIPTIYIIIAIIIAVAAGIVIYFTFMDKSQENKYNGFFKRLYNYLHFNTLILKDFLKIFYIIGSIFIIFISFIFIKYSFLLFLLIILGGNILLRIIFELLMIFYNMSLDVKNISKKLK